MSELLRCEQLTKTFGAKVAVDHLDLSLESGRIIGLLGPNGSGKTTLIKMINGLLRPTAGHITVCGDPPGARSKAQVAYLPDNNFLSGWMTVRQIVTMFSDFYGDFRTELAYAMLAQLGILPESRLKTLSKGNKEKVALILVMSRNAGLYVLDEPIAGVDPATRDYILTTIIGNYNPAASVLISTHLIADVESVLDDVIFLKQGNLVLHKTADELRGEHGVSVDTLFREVFKW